MLPQAQTENNTFKNSTRNVQPISIYDNEINALKKRNGLQSWCLQVAYFCGHNTDTSFHMNRMFLTTLPISNCSPTDPLQPMKVCKNYSVTL
jgi:hypothetical protein